MTDLFSDDPGQPERESRARAPERIVYSVSDLAEILRGMLEDSLPGLWVEGEISGFRNPAGHWYFYLKDANAVLRCVMFKSKNLYVRPQPKDGDHVRLRGTVSFYQARGDLQIIAEHLEPAGEGALLRAFEELKKKLAAEGLFDERLKRPLPEVPRGIGIITSAKAAALQDILTTLRRRYALGAAWVYPVPVQGDAACPLIVKALQTLPKRAPVDVIILARGGGSLEDLWCFNHESIARAIRACAVPVVTGIGHEVDFTIADLAADLRAPTPTGAAERVAPDVADWKATVLARFDQLGQAFADGLRERMERVSRADSRLNHLHPGRRLQQHHQRLDELRERLVNAAGWFSTRPREALSDLSHRLRARHPAHRVELLRQRVDICRGHMQVRMKERLTALRHRLQSHEGLLQSLSPQRVLERGYAIAHAADGAVLRDAAQVATGDAVSVTLARGGFEAEVRKKRSRDNSG